MYKLQLKLLCKTCCTQLRSLHSKNIDDVVIVSAVRTPIIGLRSGQQQPAITATQLGAVAIEAAVKQAAVPLEALQQVYFGNVLSAGLGQAPARQAALQAGLPKSACVTTLNAASVTGLKAIMFAMQAVKLKQADAAVAGGMESISNVPYYMPRTKLKLGNVTIADGLVVDGNVKSDGSFNKKLGITKVEIVKYKKGLSRGYSSGVFDAELVSLRVMQTPRTPIMNSVC